MAQTSQFLLLHICRCLCAPRGNQGKRQWWHMRESKLLHPPRELRRKGSSGLESRRAHPQLLPSLLYQTARAARPATLGWVSTKTICIHSGSSAVSNRITGRKDLLQIRKLRATQVKWLLAPKPAVPSSRCACFLLCHRHGRDSREAVIGERDQSPRQPDVPGESEWPVRANVTANSLS